MNKISNNEHSQNIKKNDDLNNLNDLNNDEILCNCNLCWVVRQISYMFLQNKIFFQNLIVMSFFILVLIVLMSFYF